MFVRIKIAHNSITLWHFFTKFNIQMHLGIVLHPIHFQTDRMNILVKMQIWYIRISPNMLSNVCLFVWFSRSIVKGQGLEFTDQIKIVIWIITIPFVSYMTQSNKQHLTAPCISSWYQTIKPTFLSKCKFYKCTPRSRVFICPSLCLDECC